MTIRKAIISYPRNPDESDAYYTLFGRWQLRLSGNLKSIGHKGKFYGFRLQIPEYKFCSYIPYLSYWTGIPEDEVQLRIEAVGGKKYYWQNGEYIFLKQDKAQMEELYEFFFKHYMMQKLAGLISTEYFYEEYIVD